MSDAVKRLQIPYPSFLFAKYTEFAIKRLRALKNIAVREDHLYRKAYAKGRKYVGRYTVVYVMKDLKASRLAKANPQKKKVNRLGLTVTKKLGGAVIRNRVKRVLREAYRLIEKDGVVRHGNIVIIVARDAAKTAKSTEIEEELRKAFSKLEMTFA